ncbi:Paired amphipathic helix protein Sin3-like 4 [Camellia lanceoleosa]|uniref:Paired amphipathic helix protein Sin3-like 4 n=1 Tax=Camellia lanceoleosa TaxID=1840588 RepID=A0ACC0IP02_9ERIC|nr:Paired amphipathic helix protein Sin3-like 4 [Camellia lanceoleosa]
MEFEYHDSDIHEDLYHLVKYSCGEVCTTEQPWNPFLKPMLGVPSRPKGAEDMEDVVKDKNHISQSGVTNVGESNSSPIGGTTVITTKKSNPSRNENESTPPEQSSSCRVWLINCDNGVKEDSPHDVDHTACKSDTLHNARQLGNVQSNTIVANETSRLSRQGTSNEQLVNSNTSVVAAF